MTDFNLVSFVLPDLDADEMPILVSLWLVDTGKQVARGQPLLEVLVGSACVQLPSPAQGILTETLVDEDDEVHVGQLLARIASEPADVD